MISPLQFQTCLGNSNTLDFYVWLSGERGVCGGDWGQTDSKLALVVMIWLSRFRDNCGRFHRGPLEFHSKDWRWYDFFFKAHRSKKKGKNKPQDPQDVDATTDQAIARTRNAPDRVCLHIFVGFTCSFHWVWYVSASYWHSSAV